ncbi:hypothetical protein ACTPOK_09590 [Streptomyces inhibens]|uniref:hypothetical protein n=1 Tax=Streptomyces inhibens TaxID=2293571 RepID=UPI00402A9233
MPTECSTPTVQDTPRSGRPDITPAWTSSVLARARRIQRQCRERQADEQNAAVAFAAGINGPRTHGTTADRSRHP